MQFLQAENISQSQFADCLKVSRGTLSHILSGRNRPGYDFLESVMLHYPSLSIDWLMTGRGRMYRDEQGVPADYQSLPHVEQAPSKDVSKIVVFYTDGSYVEFLPQ